MSRIRFACYAALENSFEALLNVLDSNVFLSSAFISPLLPELLVIPSEDIGQNHSNGMCGVHPFAHVRKAEGMFEIPGRRARCLLMFSNSTDAFG